MSGDSAAASWTRSPSSCGAWQFGAHLHPLLHSYLVVATVYHAFVTLFLDTRGAYERGARQLLPLLLLGLAAGLALVAAPSALYSRVLAVPAAQHEPQVCALLVPPIAGGEGEELEEQARVTYRLAYEIVLPYLLPLLLLAFPYVSLLVGLMRGIEATDHADKATKMTVVVTLWVLTSYLMLQVPSVLRWGSLGYTMLQYTISHLVILFYTLFHLVTLQEHLLHILRVAQAHLPVRC